MGSDARIGRPVGLRDPAPTLRCPENSIAPSPAHRDADQTLMPDKTVRTLISDAYVENRLRLGDELSFPLSRLCEN